MASYLIATKLKWSWNHVAPRSLRLGPAAGDTAENNVPHKRELKLGESFWWLNGSVGTTKRSTLKKVNFLHNSISLEIISKQLKNEMN